MSDMPDGFDVYPPDDERNPFYGLYGLDEFSQAPDPYDKIERDVMDSMGIASFDDILFNSDNRNLENARGNRFSSLSEAISYLFDAGVLQFGGVVYDSVEYEVEIDSDTNPV